MTRQEEQNDILNDFARRLEKLGIEYMLTGSMALAHYAMPRATTDIDLILDINLRDITRFTIEFGNDYYIPDGRIEDAIRRKRMFNALNQKVILKVDCVIRKEDAFNKLAFSRRQRVNYSGSWEVWIITKEDLILSKLWWAKDSGSEMQMRDVGNLIRNPYDETYVEYWAQRLDVTQILAKCRVLLDNYAE